MLIGPRPVACVTSGTTSPLASTCAHAADEPERPVPAVYVRRYFDQSRPRRNAQRRVRAHLRRLSQVNRTNSVDARRLHQAAHRCDSTRQTLKLAGIPLASTGPPNHCTCARDRTRHRLTSPKLRRGDGFGAHPAAGLVKPIVLEMLRSAISDPAVLCTGWCDSDCMGGWQ